MRTDTNYSENTLIVRQIRSAIGNKPKNRGTLRALGLRKIGDTNILPDRPEIRGMIARIPHLIEVTEGTPEKGTV
jgi:large subunit ribosomal protein L30